jgi:hypothetical protein
MNHLNLINHLLRNDETLKFNQFLRLQMNHLNLINHLLQIPHLLRNHERLKLNHFFFKWMTGNLALTTPSKVDVLYFIKFWMNHSYVIEFSWHITCQFFYKSCSWFLFIWTIFLFPCNNKYSFLCLLFVFRDSSSRRMIHTFLILWIVFVHFHCNFYTKVRNSQSEIIVHSFPSWSSLLLPIPRQSSCFYIEWLSNFILYWNSYIFIFSVFINIFKLSSFISKSWSR